MTIDQSAVEKFAVAFALLALAGCHRAPAPTATPSTPAAAKEAYPWPECEACVKALKDQMGEPDSLQIIEWKHRKEFFDGKQSGLSIGLKCRCKNEMGGWSAGDIVFVFWQGREGQPPTIDNFFWKKPN